MAGPDTPAPPGAGPDPAADAPSERRAREYESAHNRLFLIRILLTLLVLAAYFSSGGSDRLADGLRRRFGGAWIVVNGLYTLVTVFGFAALMFPVSWYGDFVLERKYGLSRQGLGGWFADFLKSLGLELLLVTAFFEVVYAFLRWTPGWWWAWASLFYVLFAVVLTSIAPVVIMPLFHTFEPLDNPALTSAVRAFAEHAGLQVVGVFRWGLGEKTSAANAALAGLGRTRRIILGDTMLSGYTQEEIVSVLAHEIGHYKHRDLLRMIAAGAVFATLGFYLAHAALRGLVARFGYAAASDIAAFPLFIFCLFVFSLVTMPVSNAYSRRREYAADGYAVRSMGSAGALVSALEKLAAQNLADRNPPAWIEFLLHSHPSIGRRVRRARSAEGAGTG